MTTAVDVIRELTKHADPVRAEHSCKYFKTGPGEYGEGDKFIGLKVPHTRKLVRIFRGLDFPVIEELLNSEWHEARLFALLSMVDAFKKGSSTVKDDIYKMYMGNTDRANGWDLVDSSAPHIAGAYLWDKDRQPLYDFAVSASLWKRRISMIATQHFIRKDSFDETLKIADLLLKDKEDLIHKAVGWMLREVGDKNMAIEDRFLVSRYSKMPRTMLRYAIEKFEPDRRKMFMKGLIRESL